MKNGYGNGNGNESAEASANANGRTEPKAAPRRGPSHVLRFRTLREKQDVRRAARDNGLSVNTYILTEVLAQARNYLSYKG